MKTIIEDALKKYDMQGGPTPSTGQAPVSGDDAELEKILESLTLTIKVVGCGGGGSNTITRLMESGIRGAELVACNTDAVHLKHVHANRKILLGLKTTRGLGAGGDPKMGRRAADEAKDNIEEVVKNADIVFVTCGLGGGTGTGTAPLVAEMAKAHNALVIVFATKPFKAEGNSRMESAMWGLNRLVSVADTVVTIPNDRLLDLSPKLPLDAAFHVIDELLMNSIKGIIEMVTKPALVNIDYNDLRTIMSGMGMAMVGIGQSDEREGRARLAVSRALESPLLAYDVSKAHGALVKVTGGPDMTLAEANTVVDMIQTKINPGAKIIWGAAVEPEMEGHLTVMIVITGVESPDITGKTAFAKGAPVARGGSGGKGPGELDSVR